MQIIAVTGTNGAGKGTLVRFLENSGFIHFSARSLILEEIEKHKLGSDRTAMQKIGNTLRQEHGPDYVARELLRRASESAHDKVVIESIRCIGEVHFLKSRGAVLLAVDDEVEIRYKRIVSRRDSTDSVTLDEFIEQERVESVGAEEWDMNIPACVREADYVFKNNEGLEDFRKKVEVWLGGLR